MVSYFDVLMILSAMEKNITLVYKLSKQKGANVESVPYHVVELFIPNANKSY